jgi:predicted nucleotidyltransferase
MVRLMAAHRSATGLEDTIREICRSQPVQLAYLFGSHARGTADAESDIDVAVLADPSLSKEQRHALKLRLGRALGELLPLDRGEIDVVILQDVPTLLQYNAIRGGKPVFAAHPSVRTAYELNVLNRYDDEQPLLDREAELALDRILSRAA